MDASTLDHKMSYPEFGLRNKYLEDVNDDFLYHFGIGIKTVDIPKVFGDTKVRALQIIKLVTG
ncbi:unnamed protein product [Cylicostephanus goldi]|uniref:Uncharacterized protein n=1 Tax=Cylicostephanus goldi TaxID=71465 RepID=A0A3P6STJ4_CYLGO|nr:unnamed protein product [Cylicostephanus goldi]